MEILQRLILTVLIAFVPAIPAIAAELTADSLQGKWMFTHILMEENREIKVNRVMEFLPDGTIVNYDPLGNEAGRATYEIAGDRILYEDSNGKQKWQLISFQENALHVDHRGAEMFFERQ